jgi:dihydroorotate dehydrogenase electron transfer subunit
MSKSNRGTIKSCDCQILAHYKFEGDQYILTIESAEIARLSLPGQFVHVTVSDSISLRRPISIMSVDIENSTFDLLYKVVGEGTKKLSESRIGEQLSILGPIGKGFSLTNNKLPLLIGGGVGMPPMIALAQQIKDNDYYDSLVILGSEVPFPFTPEKSNIGPMCDGVTHTMPLLEEWGVACRLTSKQNFDGVYNGYVTDLSRAYLDSLSKDELAQVEIFSCGPHQMLEAVAILAVEYNLPCQVSLEEFMACGVGGCAGCVVETKKDNVKHMMRVCVDGPVFESRDIF